jgi:transposase
MKRGAKLSRRQRRNTIRKARAKTFADLCRGIEEEAKRTGTSWQLDAFKRHFKELGAAPRLRRSSRVSTRRPVPCPDLE